MKAKIAILPGDGIGPEVTTEAVKLLQDVAQAYGHEFEFVYGQIGGIAYDQTGSPLPEATIQACQSSQAVLLGAVGGPKWDALDGKSRPEAGLLGLRKALGVYANLRPIQVMPALIHSSPLRPEVVEGSDFIIVRELTGGLYFGQPRERRIGPMGPEVVDTLVYTEAEIERIVRKAFELAQSRKRKLTSVDKANVLESSRVWREIVHRVHLDFPEVVVNHMLVDTASMQLVLRPSQFDVIVTENLFGDILSDEAATITGSIGLLPSASLSEQGPGLYEPIHGSAPDIAGQGIANPLATFLSVEFMLRYSLQLDQEADAVQNAVRTVIDQGIRTKDLAKSGEHAVSTQEMSQKVRERITGGVAHV